MPIGNINQNTLEEQINELFTIIESVYTKSEVNGLIGSIGGSFPGTMDDIADGITYVKTENNFTDTEKTNLANQSGTNTGDQDLSAYQLKPSEGAFANGDKTKLDNIETGATKYPDTGEEALTTSLKTNYDAAYTHSQLVHAPSNAQKNSDILKSEIEAVLTGEISSHSHASSGSTDDTLPTSAQSRVDDFLSQSAETGEVGGLSWTFTNGSIVAANNEQNHPGIQTRRSGTTANQVASLYLGNAVGTTVLRYDEFDTMYFVFSLVSIAAVSLRIGLFNNASSNPPINGVYLEFLAATDSEFFAVSRATSSETRRSLGTADTNWHTLKIQRVDASTVRFSLDGGADQDITTNIVGGSTGLNIGVQVIPTTTTAKDLKMDFFSLKLNAVTR